MVGVTYPQEYLNCEEVRTALLREAPKITDGFPYEMADPPKNAKIITPPKPPKPKPIMELVLQPTKGKKLAKRMASRNRRY